MEGGWREGRGREGGKGEERFKEEEESNLIKTLRRENKEPRGRGCKTRELLQPALPEGAARREGGRGRRESVGGRFCVWKGGGGIKWGVGVPVEL